MNLRRDLGLQLFAIYLLFVIPVLIAAIIFDWLAGARLERDVQAADLALAQSIALETDAILQNSLNTVNALAPLRPVQEGDVETLRPLFANIATARTEINLVYLLNAKGIMRYHYPEAPGSTIGADFSFREHFRKSQILAGPFLSNGRISPTTNVPIVTAVMPVRDADTGAYLGIVATNLSLHRLSGPLAKIASDPDDPLRVTLVDESGQIVGDSNPARLLSYARPEFPDEINRAQLGQQGSLIGRDDAGREWLRSYAPIVTVQWTVIVQRPTDVAFATSRAFHNGLLIAIAVFVGGGILFWVVLSRRVISPLEKLSAFSSAISRRDVTSTDRAQLQNIAARQDQVGALSRSLATMEQNIERRITELNTLLDTSTAVVSTLDSPRVLDTILEQVQRLLNVNMCAIVILDERTNTLRLRAARGLSAEYVRSINSLHLPPDENSPSLRAMLTRELVQVRDTKDDPTYPEMFRARARLEGFRALVAVPLITRHAPHAALVLYWRDAHECAPQEIQLIVNFANHAAMAIENAALFGLTDEKLREQTRTLEAIVQSLNDGLVLANPDGRVVYFNRRVCELADLPPDAVSQATASSLQERLLAHAETKPAREPNGAVRELTLRRDGRALDLRLQSFNVTDEKNQVIGRGELWLDVTGDKELDRIKSALITAVSHELRTPLAGIKGNITSLLEDDVQWDANAQRDFLQAASKEVDRLSNLVTDLLDLSRIQAGMFTVHREWCSLQNIAERAAQHAHLANTARIVYAIDDDVPLLMADPLRLETVLRNLFENAFKYAPADSPIKISAQRDNGSVIVRVADEGPGIPPEHREKIFDRFYRVENGITRHIGGAGIGLAICKGFITTHGGKIWVEDSARGTVIAFELPSEREQVARDA